MGGAPRTPSIFGAVPAQFSPERTYKRDRAEELVAALTQILRTEEVEGVTFDILPECPNLWASESALGIYEAEFRNPQKMVFAEVCIDPIDYIRLQAAQGALAPFKERPRTRPDGFLRKFRPDDEESTNVGVFVEKLRGDLPTDIPIPIVQFNADAEWTGFQEGRTRGVAAYLAGFDAMNCLFAVNYEGRHHNERPDVGFYHQWEDFLDGIAEDYDRRTAAVDTARPESRWQRLMESSHEAIEDLGITEGSLPDRGERGDG